MIWRNTLFFCYYEYIRRERSMQIRHIKLFTIVSLITYANVSHYEKKRLKILRCMIYTFKRNGIFLVSLIESKRFFQMTKIWFYDNFFLIIVNIYVLLEFCIDWIEELFKWEMRIMDVRVHKTDIYSWSDSFSSGNLCSNSRGNQEISYSPNILLTSIIIIFSSYLLWKLQQQVHITFDC